MTAKQWLKRYRAALSPLPKAERERAAEYYAELFADRAEAGESEEAIARDLGDPARAAGALLAESGAAAKKGRGAGRRVLLAVLMGIPACAATAVLWAVLVALPASFVLTALCGLGGAGFFVWTLAAEGFAGGALALCGTSLAAAGAGAMLLVPALLLSRLLLRLCNRMWRSIADFARGEGEEVRA